MEEENKEEGNKTLLDEAIQDAFESYPLQPLSSDERKAAFNEAESLYKLWINEQEIELGDQQHNLDGCLKQAEIENHIAEQRKDRIVHIALGAAELILPLIFYGRWMKRGFKFEETGTYTSGTFRNLFNRFKPTK